MWTVAICLALSLLTSSPLLLWTAQAKSEKMAEINSIDERIWQLKEMKRGFEGKAIRAENQAERMQFEDRFILETRQYFKIAEENRQKAQLVQDEIDRLEKRKAELLGS